MAAALSNSGNVFYYQGRYAEALAFQEQALVVLRAHRLTAQPGILNNIAALYRSPGKNSEAAEYFVQAMRLFDSLGRWDERTVAEENLAGIYKDQKDYDKAEAIYTRALQRATERKDVYRMASLWQNMAALSMARGDTAMAERLSIGHCPSLKSKVPRRSSPWHTIIWVSYCAAAAAWTVLLCWPIKPCPSAKRSTMTWARRWRCIPSVMWP